MSPFHALYGRTPPTIPCYTRTSSSIQAVDDILTQHDQLLRTLKRNLQEAQQRMTYKANAHRQDFEFSIGDLVLLRLQPYRQSTVAARHSHKLSKRFYGPFSVIARIGQVAYRLGLPESSRIHPVFHISVWKPFRGAHSPLISRCLHLLWIVILLIFRLLYVLSALFFVMVIQSSKYWCNGQGVLLKTPHGKIFLSFANSTHLTTLRTRSISKRVGMIHYPFHWNQMHKY